jgi:hypothetical protein
VVNLKVLASAAVSARPVIAFKDCTPLAGWNCSLARSLCPRRPFGLVISRRCLMIEIAVHLPPAFDLDPKAVLDKRVDCRLGPLYSRIRTHDSRHA